MTLTPKMIRFIEEYMSLGNASEAYRRAYDPHEAAVSVGQRAYDLLKKPEMAAKISELKNEAFERTTKTREDLLRYWWDRATYDPNEIVALSNVPCRHCYGEGFRYQWRLPDFEEECRKAEAVFAPLPDIAGGFGYTTKRPPNPDCPKCDGDGLPRQELRDTLKLSAAARAGLDGVKQTKDGIQLILADRAQAMIQFAKISGLEVFRIDATTDAGQLAAAAKMETTDPVEAAKIYQKLMKGHDA